ncbi:MAG: outer membrane beta-barrel protein [Bacteroidota bacterium]
MIKKSYLLLIVIIFNTASLLAQTGFRKGIIITSKNEVIRGLIYKSDGSNYETCQFKEAPNANVVSYSPNDLKLFQFIDGIPYRSINSIKIKDPLKIVDSDVPVFLELIVDGSSSLYRYKKAYYITKSDSSLIKYDNGNVTALSNNGDVQKTKILSYFLNDCDKLPALSDKKNLSEKDLISIIEQYNKCQDVATNAFSDSKPVINTKSKISKGPTTKTFSDYKSIKKIDFGISMGYTNSRMSVKNKLDKYRYLDKSYNSIDPKVGLVFNITFPRFMENISFSTELNFVKSWYSSLVVIDNLGSGTSYYDTFIDLTYLEIPLSLKYLKPILKGTLEIQGGINIDSYINAETKLIAEEVVDNVVTTSESDALAVKSKQSGYLVGINYRMPLKYFKAGLGIRYIYNKNFSGDEDLFVNNDRISVSLIITKK